MDTAKLIKELRESTGLSRKDFSEHTGIPVRTLEDWEAGRRTPPEYIPRLLAYQMKYEELIREKLYEIRGVKVMLDADLAEIYGYTTKAFNQQIKNNIEKFDDDFMFELSDEEVEDLRSKNLTANLSSKSRYNPHVFTEQGLYMLMTVLKGPLAVRQSKSLIRTFKKMKDYILDNQSLIGQREVMQLSIQAIENATEISKFRIDIGTIEKQMSDVMNQLNDVVTKSELADMMNSFVSDEDNGWLLYNTKYCSADVAYYGGLCLDRCL